MAVVALLRRNQGRTGQAEAVSRRAVPLAGSVFKLVVAACTASGRESLTWRIP